MAKSPGQAFQLTRLPFPPSLAICESSASGRRELTEWGVAQLGVLVSLVVVGFH
jgi:hypothetical protein